MESPINSPLWKQFDVAIKRNFDSYDSAQRTLSYYECDLNSTSNASIKLGKGMRKKISKRFNTANSDSKSERHWESVKKKPRLKKKIPPTTIEFRHTNSPQDFCEVQMFDPSDGSVDSMESQNFSDSQSTSSAEQLLPSKPARDEKCSDKLKELVCLLLKNQHNLEEGITELDKEISCKIDSIAKCIPEVRENSCSEIEFLHYFPLNSVKDFDAVNELLCDEEKSNSLGEILCSASGPTVRKCVNAMMKLLFKDSLCIDVGLTSQNRKRGFQNTNLMKCLYSAISKREPDLTLKELHFCVSDWFRRYKDRLYGKIRPSQFKNRETENIFINIIKEFQERLHETNNQVNEESNLKNTVKQNFLQGEKSEECAEDPDAPIDFSSPKSSFNGDRISSTHQGSSQTHSSISLDKEKPETCSKVESSICFHHISFIKEKSKVQKLEKRVCQLMEFVNVLKEENLSQKKEISRLKDEVKFVETLKHESQHFEENLVLQYCKEYIFNHSSDSHNISNECLVKEEIE
ncbi:UNVERIFIED_CONTAM: hypothetical protein RMT77_015841 [Armadillidium vulgare]